MPVIEQGLLQQLAEIHCRCEEIRQHTETACRAGQDLFKPWPKKEKKKKSSPDDPVEIESNNTGNVHIKANTEPVPDPEVEMVEMALAKAQKARHFQAKLQKSDEELRKVSTSQDLDPQENNQPSHHEGPENFTARKTAPKAASAKLEPIPARTRASLKHSKTIGTISKSHLDNLIGPSTSGNKRINTRPKSANRPAPTYTSAPFKTEPPSAGVRRPQFKVTKGQGQSRAVSSTAAKPAGLASATRAVKTKSVTIDQNVQGGHRAGVRDVPTTSNSVSSTESRVQVEDSLVKGLDGLSVKEEAEAESPAFCLAKQGSQLPVPSKLQRLHAANRRLREKLNNASLTKKVEEKNSQTYTAQQFCDRLEQNLSEELQEDHVGQAVTKMATQSRVYRNLLSLMNETCSTCCSDATPWEEILRKRKKLELILTTFADLEEQYRGLMKGAGMLTPRSTSCCQVSKPTSVSTGPMWLQSEGELQPFVASLRPSVSRLRYRSARQLECYSSVLHQAQLLKLQLCILDELETGALQFLEEFDTNQSGATMMYRSLYSMLCHGGSTFPALVQDTIEDLEECDPTDF